MAHNLGTVGLIDAPGGAHALMRAWAVYAGARAVTTHAILSVSVQQSRALFGAVRPMARQELISAVMLPLTLAAVSGERVGVAATNTYSYTIDSRSKNRTFDGVGALSGGGATTKLLPEYPLRS